ncbi:YueI family protein [Fructilactobacillus vespulae]|uniref:DUF1694 domain-containing protein n=1 Tax=Fructilactobacillus vespulae TaxID=1249630 RepID=UPI0039B5CA4A
MTEDVQNRLDQSMSGESPKINPDEQRKYLGTFRERVALAIPFAQVTNSDAVNQTIKIIQMHPDYQIIINGALPTNQQSPYLKAAAANNAKFNINTDKIYQNTATAFAIVVAAKQSINETNIEFSETTSKTVNSPKTKLTFWQKLFNRNKEG